MGLRHAALRHLSGKLRTQPHKAPPPCFMVRSDRPVCTSRAAAHAAAPRTENEEHAVVSELRHALSAHALVSPGDAVVACVSGGVDSVALLLALARVAPEVSLSLHVLHFNHAIRVRDFVASSVFASTHAPNRAHVAARVS